jgi:hypothetical protein
LRGYLNSCSDNRRAGLKAALAGGLRPSANKLFSAPLVGPMLGNVRDHIESQQNDDRPSYMHRGLRRPRQLKPDLARFSELLNFRLFRQHRSNAEVGSLDQHVRSTPDSRRRYADRSARFVPKAVDREFPFNPDPDCFGQDPHPEELPPALSLRGHLAATDTQSVS